MPGFGKPVPRQGFLQDETRAVCRCGWEWAGWVVAERWPVLTKLLMFPILWPDAFEIRRLSSVFLRVRTNVGVRVLYDREGLRLYLQVDQRWVEDTVGLCGTFNGNTQDDFLYVSLPLRVRHLGALPDIHTPLLVYFSTFKSNCNPLT